MDMTYEFLPFTAENLPPDAWKPFLNTGDVQLYRSGRLLYSQGDPANCFYYITNGKVKTFISSPDGNERLLTIYHGGNILGEAAFFDEQPRVSSAQIVSDAHILSIDRTALQNSLQASPELVFSLLKYLSQTVRMLSAHLDTLSFLSAQQRILRFLLHYSASGEVRCTHEEMGSALGVSRVTVSRTLKDMERRGLIRLSYRRIELLNLPAIKALLVSET